MEDFKYNPEQFYFELSKTDLRGVVMVEMNVVTLVHYLGDVYESTCRPLCKEMGITQTAFSILMFLADYPEYYTAKDVSEFRAIKPNIVSFNVDKLVEKGYLERHNIPGNRRSIRLVCTEKAHPFIEKGRNVLSDFYASLTTGMRDEDMAQFKRYLNLIGNNIISIRTARKSMEKGSI